MHLQNIGLNHIHPLNTAQLWEEIHCIPFDNREVLIVIDDFTRPITPITRMVVEYAISEVGEDKVAVVVASGLHRASTNHEVSAKIGPELTKRLRIYHHSPLGNFPLNKDTYNIIAVGCVMPHTFAGLSGDAKIVLPGLQTYENIMAFHGSSKKSSSAAVCRVKDNVDTYVNYTINCYGDPTRIRTYRGGEDAGGFRADAWNDYSVILPDPTDIAVLIPRFKNVDFQQSMNAMRVFIDTHQDGQYVPVKRGGVICIQSDTPEGMGVHYGFQYPNGLQPVYYDDVFKQQYRSREICFVCPNVTEKAIQEYFRREIFNFPTMDDFSKFVELRYGRTATVAFYHAADIMIGEHK
jgi:hypothetical protein